MLLPAPEQVFIDGDVDPGRIAAGVVLFPGTRLHGPRTYLAEGVRVGTEGPATLRDWLLAQTGMPDWLLDETYAEVGDLAETIAL